MHTLLYKHCFSLELGVSLEAFVYDGLVMQKRLEMPAIGRVSMRKA